MRDFHGEERALSLRAVHKVAPSIRCRMCLTLVMPLRAALEPCDETHWGSEEVHMGRGPSVVVAASLALSLLAATSASSQTSLLDCAVPVAALGVGPVDGTEPGLPVPSARTEVGLRWPPGLGVGDPEVDALLDGSVLASAAMVAEDGSLLAWLALVAEGEATASSFGHALQEGELLVLRLLLLRHDRPPEEILWVGVEDHTYEGWGVPAADFEHSIRLRTQGSRLAEACLPIRFGNSEDVEGTGVDEEWVEVVCHTFLDLLASEDASDVTPDAEAVVRVGPSPPARYTGYLTLRDLDADGHPELLRWHRLGFLAFDQEGQLLPLERQPIWHEVLWLAGETEPTEATYRALHTRLRVLSEESFAEPTVEAGLRCVREATMADFGALLLRRLDAVAVWHALAEIEEPSQLLGALSSRRGPELFELPWDLDGIVLGSSGLVRWEDENHLLVVREGGAAVRCELSSAVCLPIEPPDPLPDVTLNPSGTRGLACATALRPDVLRFLWCEPGSCQLGFYCACAATFADETEVTELSLSALGTDGVVGPQEPDCAWVGFAEPALGPLGWLDDEQVLYASQDRFYAIARAGFSPIEPSALPERLLGVAGVTPDRARRYFLTSSIAPGFGALWMADLATGETSFLHPIESAAGAIGWPDGYVLLSPDGARLVAVAHNEIVGAFSLAGPVASGASPGDTLLLPLAESLGAPLTAERGRTIAEGERLRLLVPSEDGERHLFEVWGGTADCTQRDEPKPGATWLWFTGDAVVALEVGETLAAWRFLGRRGCRSRATLSSYWSVDDGPSVPPTEAATPDGFWTAVHFELTEDEGPETVALGPPGLVVTTSAGRVLLRHALPALEDPSTVAVSGITRTPLGEVRLQLRLAFFYRSQPREHNLSVAWYPGAESAHAQRETLSRREEAWLPVEGLAEGSYYLNGAACSYDESALVDGGAYMTPRQVVSQFRGPDGVVEHRVDVAEVHRYLVDVAQGCGVRRRSFSATWSLTLTTPEGKVIPLIEPGSRTDETDEVSRIVRRAR
jgi:hypothetical protein